MSFTHRAIKNKSKVKNHVTLRNQRERHADAVVVGS